MIPWMALMRRMDILGDGAEPRFLFAFREFEEALKRCDVGMTEPMSGAIPRSGTHRRKGEKMRFIWLILALFLLFAWIGGFAVYHVSGALIHLLLVFAVISVVIHLFSARSSA